jgi:hypothetical protein
LSWIIQAAKAGEGRRRKMAVRSGFMGWSFVGRSKLKAESSKGQSRFLMPVSPRFFLFTSDSHIRFFGSRRPDNEGL